jgi:transposase
VSKFKPYDENQMLLLPASVAEYVPEQHLARVIKEVVQRLDLSKIEKKYHELGQKSYAPQILISLLIYGYATGVRSGRKIAKACESDTAFMYLANLYRPDFRTINDFRKDNIELFKEYFVEVLTICKKLGLVHVGSIAIDGTKTRANASSKRSKTKEEYDKWRNRIKEEVDELMKQVEENEKKESDEHGDQRGDELPKKIREKKKLISKIEEIMKVMTDEEKLNLTDRDAKFIKDKGEIKPNYAGMIAVTEEGIITATTVITSANEGEELMNLVLETEKHTSDTVEQVLADAAYGTYSNYEALHNAEKTAYIPDQTVANEKKKKYRDKPEEEKGYKKSKFQYVKETDSYTCPTGEQLIVAGKSSEGGREYIVYKCNACQNCPVKHLCTTSENRQIKREVREHLKEEVLARLRTKEGESVYAKRGWMVETKFGHFKHNLNYHMFSLRSLKKVTGEFELICMANNLTKMFQWKTKMALCAA